MAADDLVMEGAKASAAMALIYFTQSIPISAPDGLNISKFLTFSV